MASERFVHMRYTIRPEAAIIQYRTIKGPFQPRFADSIQFGCLSEAELPNFKMCHHYPIYSQDLEKSVESLPLHPTLNNCFATHLHGSFIRLNPCLLLHYISGMLLHSTAVEHLGSPVPTSSLNFFCLHSPIARLSLF